MDKEELEQLVDDLHDESGDVKPVPTKEGMIAYRKYLWAIHFIQSRVDQLEEYKKQVIDDIDTKINKEKENIERLRSSIEMALEVDPIAEKVKTGGRKLVLPDVATVSISKVTDKVIIDDPEAVLEALGQEFGKVKVSLDTTKAKKFIVDQPEGKLPEGSRKEKSRTLSIRFTR